MSKNRMLEYDFALSISEFSPSLGMNLEQFLVALLALSPNQEIYGKSRFQKLMFILNDHFHLFKDLDFHRDYYGKFSDVLEEAFCTLLVHKFVDQWVEYPPELKGKYVIHRLITDKGWQTFRDFLESNYASMVKVMEIVTFLHSQNYYKMPLKDLLQIAYEIEGLKK